MLTRNLLRWMRIPVAYCTTSAQIAEPADDVPIKVPKRIKRSPTDLLKALALTVKDDPTAAHYKYHDDPYLMPASSYTRQTYALGKEAGRKAARYFAREFPTLFMYDKDEPRIMSYRLLKPTSEEKGKTEAELFDRMGRLWVQSAIAVYENMVTANVAISEETLLRFFEFLCYFNCTDPDELMPEQNWLRYELNLSSSSSNSGVWKQGGLAMKIFDGMQKRSARAYAAVICGMAKHMAPKEANEYFALMREEGLTPDVFVYNRVLSCVSRVKNINSERWEAIMELLRAMKQDGVQPNVDTFNSILAQLRVMKWPNAADHALEVYREMVSLQLQPRLGTYACLVDIFRQRVELEQLLDHILDSLEGKRLEVRDSLDELFFPRLMSCANEVLQDPNVAYRIHKLLNTEQNETCITSFTAETNYYQNLLMLVARTQPADEFFDFYHKHVPRHYSPNARFIGHLIQCLEMTASYEYFPEVWSEMVRQGLNERSSLEAEFFLAALGGNIEDQQLRKKLSAIVWDAYNVRCALYTDERRKRVRENSRFTGQLVMLQACLSSRAGDFDHAWQILRLVLPSKALQDLNKEEAKIRESIVDKPEVDGATAVFLDFLNTDDSAKQRQLLSYVADLCDIGKQELCQKLVKLKSLPEEQVKRLEALQD